MAVLDLEVFEAIAKANPFKNAESEGKTLHVWFLVEPSSFDASRADALAATTERYAVTDQAIYLHAPDGIGRSKLAAKMENLAGVRATARNWNTVTKLLDLANA